MPARTSTVNLLGRLKAAKLRVGATLTLRIAAPGMTAKSVAFTVRKGKVPRLTD